jgi:general secretion pathway protein G
MADGGYLATMTCREFTQTRRGVKSASSSNSLTPQGFTIVELLVTVAIILTISAIATPRFLSAIDQAKVARAVGDIRTIGTGIQGYQIVKGQYPATLAEVGYGTNLDPWGQAYQYLNFASVNGKGAMRKDRFLVPINTFFDLYSMGKDGDSIAPLTAKVSQDDVIWANDGNFVGLASDY